MTRSWLRLLSPTISRPTRFLAWMPPERFGLSLGQTLTTPMTGALTRSTQKRFLHGQRWSTGGTWAQIARWKQKTSDARSSFGVAWPLAGPSTMIPKTPMSFGPTWRLNSASWRGPSPEASGNSIGSPRSLGQRTWTARLNFVSTSGVGLKFWREQRKPGPDRLRQWRRGSRDTTMPAPVWPVAGRTGCAPLSAEFVLGCSGVCAPGPRL